MELLRRYSNRDDLLKPLVSVLGRINQEPSSGEKEAQLTSADGPTPRAWQVSDRLSPTDIKTLVTSYLAGSTTRVLAACTKAAHRSDCAAYWIAFHDLPGMVVAEGDLLAWRRTPPTRRGMSWTRHHTANAARQAGSGT